MARPETHRVVHEALEKVMEAELGGIAAIFQQTINDDWRQACNIITDANRVFVTGFQSVRGIAEDCVRRLSLARGDVIYFSPYDNMLAEWTDVDSQSAPPEDRKSVGEGKSVSVRVDPGGRRIINTQHIRPSHTAP